MGKTQIIVFRKGGYLACYEKFYYGGKQIDIVNSYKYLGIDFTTKLSFVNSTAGLIAKAKRSCFEITKSLNKINCTEMKIFTKLFDSKVQPILSYASELWGMQNLQSIEQVHTSFLKRFLGVSQHSSNNILYGETGRYPISINLKIKCLKYWFRLLSLPQQRYVRQAYDWLEKQADKGEKNWVFDIREMLCTNGFGYVWMFKQVGSIKEFCTMFKMRLYDIFIQN